MNRDESPNERTGRCLAKAGATFRAQSAQDKTIVPAVDLELIAWAQIEALTQLNRDRESPGAISLTIKVMKSGD